MPGLTEGLLPLALAAYAVRHDKPVPDADYGPHTPWIRPLLESERSEAVAALRTAPDPPPGLLLEAHWALIAHAARQLGETQTLERARTALAPASGEQAGAASGLLTLGPVTDYL
jgi:hypothetical protein